MKFRCILTIEADNGREAFNKLMDLVTENGIELAVSVVEDEEFERATPDVLDRAFDPEIPASSGSIGENDA